jgi:hypothetical protein
LLGAKEKHPWLQNVVVGIRRSLSAAASNSRKTDGLKLTMARGSSGGFRISLVFHAIAFAFDDDGLGMTKDAIEQRGGQRAVVVEDFRPVFNRAV